MTDFKCHLTRLVQQACAVRTIVNPVLQQGHWEVIETKDKPETISREPGPGFVLPIQASALQGCTLLFIFSSISCMHVSELLLVWFSFLGMEHAKLALRMLACENWNRNFKMVHYPLICSGNRKWEPAVVIGVKLWVAHSRLIAWNSRAGYEELFSEKKNWTGLVRHLDLRHFKILEH